jgi:hypothetical protein
MQAMIQMTGIGVWKAAVCFEKRETIDAIPHSDINVPQHWPTASQLELAKRLRFAASVQTTVVVAALPGIPGPVYSGRNARTKRHVSCQSRGDHV